MNKKSERRPTSEDAFAVLDAAQILSRRFTARWTGLVNTSRQIGSSSVSHRKDWYWLEDPPHKCESDALARAGMLDRYLCVDPQGPWGFVDAVRELFRRSGKTADDIECAGGSPKCFDRAAIAAHKPGKGRPITKPSEPRDLAQVHSEFLQSGIEICDALGATAEADEPDRSAQDGFRRSTGSVQEDPA